MEKFQEMVAIKLHHYFTYDTASKHLIATAERKLEDKITKGTCKEKETGKAEELDKKDAELKLI